MELTPDQLRQTCEPSSLGFTSTEELPSLDTTIGQERAVRAVSFGVDIASPGYHLYGLGPAGTGKTTTIKALLESRAAKRAVPGDWCYVNNFADPEKPRALELPGGRGAAFRADMEQLVEELKVEVPRAFEADEYQKEGERLQEELQKQQQSVMEELKKEAESKGFALVQTPRGIVLAPVIDGEVVTPDEFGKLDDETTRSIEGRQEELQEKVRDTMRRMQQLQKEAKGRLKELDRHVIRFAVEHLLEELRSSYSELPDVVGFLDEVRDDLLDKVQEFKELRQGEQQQSGGFPLNLMQGQQKPTFDEYRVNLIVDNSATEGAPVVLERNPTAQNLLGRVEHEARFGALVTNFSMIRGGALHRANGGYLILEARDVLTRPFAWNALKRALKNAEVKIESIAAEYMAIATRSLEPQSIPLDVKVVLIGEPMLYYLLHNLDEDFRELFKVKADFATHTDWDQEMPRLYARFLADLCRHEELRHFSADGVAAIVEHAARMAADREKLATRFGEIVDLAREASYWAGSNGARLTTAAAVRRAIEEKVYRSNRVEERLREMVRDGTILIDTEGEAAGQVNGLAVLMLGDYAFGKPSRITARTFVGNAGVVNIDRETKLGGRIHNKGALILAGYLGGRFAQEIPLALSASITFEQLYEGVEGDSASSAELYALLSSLAGAPVRQDLAVTGSVNQHGQVQAIGGVNEKIEGFFDVCRMRGLTGRQGVLIPAANVRNLMLREDVVHAVQEGAFHIHAVSTIDEGIALLTGRPAGAPGEDGSYPEGTVNRAVRDRLRELAVRGRSFARSERGGGRDAEGDDNGASGSGGPREGR